MPVVINVSVADRAGWHQLRFPFNRALVDLIKSVPGSKWDPAAKLWRVSTHGLVVLAPLIRTAGFGVINVPVAPAPSCPPLYLKPGSVLRPYQLAGYARMMSRTGYGLTFDPRVGKTICAVAGIACSLAERRAERAIVLYPASIKEEWERQLTQFAALTLTPVDGSKMPTEDEVVAWASQPWLVLGCHYEILGFKAPSGEGVKPEGLLALADEGPFVLVADEIQNAKNRKAPRTKVMLALAAHVNCVHRWALTGTPMRNRPRDLFTFFEFLQPGSVGGYWKFAQRYAEAIEGAYGWEDFGSSNEDELAVRLNVVSYRLRREDVAAYLPKSDRKVLLCALPTTIQKEYNAAARQLAPQLTKALADTEPTGATVKALEHLASITTKAKVDTIFDRCRFHVVERGVKVIIFANFHDSLKQVWDALDPDDAGLGGKEKPLGAAPVFCAGGWMTPDKRFRVREQWKLTPGPAVLLANTLSSGIGIDMSEADGSIFAELCWVPADFIQAESRIIDIHLGKRSTPPWFEYILARGTIDSDMGIALIEKVQNIGAVVGDDAALVGMANTLRASGVVNESTIALNKADPAAVATAIERLRDRLLGRVSDPSDTVQASLAVGLEEALDDDVDAHDANVDERENDAL